jgi:hypothetical protein
LRPDKETVSEKEEENSKRNKRQAMFIILYSFFRMLVSFISLYCTLQTLQFVLAKLLQDHICNLFRKNYCTIILQFEQNKLQYHKIMDRQVLLVRLVYSQTDTLCLCFLVNKWTNN